MSRGSPERRQTAPYPALTIAKWFIAWAEAEGEELSNLKLQKLLYYAQGHHLAERHQPLFPDQIQAWSHGPVIPEVYHAYKGCGSATIELPGNDVFTWDDVDSETTKLLSRVWNTYGGFSAGHLRNMTHEEAPWRAHFRPDERNIVIPDSEIEGYFAKRSRRS
jgi:uncharacterized phage-associated protein